MGLGLTLTSPRLTSEKELNHSVPQFPHHPFIQQMYEEAPTPGQAGGCRDEAGKASLCCTVPPLRGKGPPPSRPLVTPMVSRRGHVPRGPGET